MLVLMAIFVYFFFYGGSPFRAFLAPTQQRVDLVQILYAAFLSIFSAVLYLRSGTILQRGLWGASALASLTMFMILFLNGLRLDLGRHLTWAAQPVSYLVVPLILAALVLRPESWRAYQKS